MRTLFQSFKFAGLFATAVLGFYSDARARDNGYYAIDQVAPTRTRGHNSVLRIQRSELGQSRAVQLGRNKSMLIELPQELRDVVVSNPEIIDAVVQSSNRVYLIGKANGQANAFFFDSNGDQILTLEVLVEHDTAALDALLNRLLPGANIKTEILNETVILTGSVRNPADANRAADIASRFIVSSSSSNSRDSAKVINMLSVAGEEQVMLRVTVAEVQRSALKQLGINIGAIVNSGNFITTLLTENSLPLTAARGLGTLPLPGIKDGELRLYNQGPENAFGNSGLVGGWTNSRNSVLGTIRALERNGLLKTLAEPNLTAVSGESAKFLAGGKFPIPVPDGDGGYGIQFEEFGVRLTFTPQVLSEGRISLKIETSVSELTNEGAIVMDSIAVPALKSREAQSTVELPSGGSLAIAGLIRDEVRQNIDGFPGLKNLPVLGTLFRSRDFIKEETELVIIVTPYTVRSVSRDQLARPDDGLAPATDMKANFLGHLNRIYGRIDPLPQGSLKDDYGFIVE